jgi:hypothetical protein
VSSQNLLGIVLRAEPVLERRRGGSGRAVAADTPDGSHLGKPENQAPRIQVNELVTDRCWGNRTGKGRERQDAHLREELLERIVRAGAYIG